jgi:hypothetical protein
MTKAELLLVAEDRAMVKPLVILVIVQMIAVGLALAAALLEIETIVVSGPLLSASGAIIAGLAAPRGLWRNLFYGLSVPMISLMSFLLIQVFDWGPHAARLPIGILLSLFALASLPFGVQALREVDPRVAQLPRPFQFRILTLLLVMLALSPPLALMRHDWGFSAVAALTVYGMLLGLALHHVYAAPNRILREKDKDKACNADSCSELERTWDEICTWPDYQRRALANRLLGSL